MPPPVAAPKPRKFSTPPSGLIPFRGVIVVLTHHSVQCQLEYSAYSFYFNSISVSAPQAVRYFYSAPSWRPKRRRAPAGPDADPGAAARDDLRSDRLRHDADPYPVPGQAIPLLRFDGRHQVGCRSLPGAARAGRRDRGGVVDQVRALIRMPEIVVRTWCAARVEMQ